MSATASYGSARTRAVPFAAAAGLLVVGATLFNFVLCFVNTEGVKMGLQTIAVVQLLIIGLAALAAREVVLVTGLQTVAIVAGWLAFLVLVNPAIDAKVAVDIAMPMAFYALGMSFGTAKTADRLVWWLAIAVLVIGLFEMFDLDTFSRYFNIYAYYVDKGALPADHASDTGTTLAENGMRAAGDGRALFPALGLHRVGSVFLEPISAGNFAVILVGWYLARRPSGTGPSILLVVAALVIGVLADARFSVATSLVITAGMVAQAWRSRLLLAAMPFALVLFLVMFAEFGGVAQVDNSVGGRFFSSGSLLAGWNALNWLALAPFAGSTFDAGYAYLISNLGLIVAGALWVGFTMRKPDNDEAARFLFAMSVYLCLGLCVSGAALSIKTGAMMWFIYGALNRAPSIDPEPAVLQA